MTPVKFDHAGVIADFRFEVTEHLVYYYSLRFQFPENDQAERTRVRKILGGYEVDEFGKAREPGAPTPIRFSIVRVDLRTEVQVYLKEIDPLLTSWGGNSFDKLIGRCDLPPGIYRARIEALKSSLELSSIPTYFVMGSAKFKTSFDPKKADRRQTCPQ